ncbi:MAG: hypothetical protein GXY83_34725 [Rhodopirellula sp.]|nr:hypothetical protein [Rhodopirellula sp.]
MRRHFIAIAVLLLANDYVQAQENLLLTGDFEDGVEGIPVGWKFKLEDGAEGTCTLDPDTVRSGQHSVRIRKTSGRGFQTLTTAEMLPITPGQRYEVRAHVHTPDATFGSQAYFCLRQYTADKGRALSPHIFSPHDQRIAIRCRPEEWSTRSTVFTARPGAAFLDIVLVVNGNPCTIYFDDLYFGSPIASTYTAPRLTAEKLHSEEEVYARLAQREDATATVRTIDGQPTLLINGEPTPPMLHLMTFWRPTTSYNGDFGRADMHIHVCPIVFSPYLADGTHLWKAKGEYDFAKADEVLMYALRADPDGYLVPDIVMLGLYPGWGDQHQGEVCQDIEGNRAIGKSVHNTRYGAALADAKEFWCPSLYSQAFRDDGSQLVRDYIAHLKQTPLWKAVVGFTITGGDDGQFSSYRRSGPDHEPDYSPAARRDFGRLLRERYGDDAALRAAWHDPEVTFDTVSLPSPEERRAAGQTFRDPATDTRIADYARFLSEGTCDTVRAFAGAAKDAAGKPVFTTTYWGAHVMGTSLNHFGSRRLMSTPEIDIIHAPAGYGPWRRLGQSGCNHTTPGSLRLHNKICLQELDLRTFTHGYRDEAWRMFIAWAENLDEFVAINRREMGLMMACGMGCWYYDMSGGWFHDEGIMQDIAGIHAGYRAGLANVTDWHPDMAVFADEESSHWLAEGMRQVIFSSLNTQRAALNTSGVPYDRYITDDLTHPDMGDYKIYVFLNAYRLTDAHVAAIDGLKRDGKTLVFMYAPGYVADDGLSIERTSRLVGMRLACSQVATAMAGEAMPVEHPLGDGLLPVQGSSHAAKFWVDDTEAVVLGRYIDGGEASLAARDFGAWRSVYVAIPGSLGPDLLHNIARWSDAYVASVPGDSIYTNGHLLCVHGVMGGRKQIALPHRATVMNELTGEVMAREATSITVDVPLQRTLWLRLDWN